MKRPVRDFASLVGDVVLVLSALLAIGISILDFVGFIDRSGGLGGRIPTLTLLSIGLILIATVLDRHTKLNRIQHLLERSLDSYVSGIQYLQDSDEVLQALVDTVQGARDLIMSMGSKSTATSYLRQVTRKVTSGEVMYYRLLLGDHITHDLHTHLSAVVDLPRVQIAWNRSEKYGGLTLSELGVVVLLPSPYWNKYTGIRLPGERNARIYTQYFLEAFSKSIPVRSKHAIEALCEKCSPGSTRNEAEIERLLREDIASIPVDEPGEATEQ